MSEAGIRSRWRKILAGRQKDQTATQKRDSALHKVLATQKAGVAAAKRVLKRHQPKAVVAGPTQMYDSVTVSQIPAGAPAVAGYTAGNFTTFPTLVKQFPHARRVSIAVASRFDADILDIEPGDATPEVAAAWVKRQKARGVKRPGIYCSVASANHVLGVLAKSGIERKDIRLWTAHYTHRAHVCDTSCGFMMPTRADATQFTDKALGRNLDESLCAPSFWT